jgi:hypothetical protein
MKGPRTPVGTALEIALILVLAALAACAWEIFTSGHIENDADATPVCVPDSVLLLDNEPIPVLVEDLMTDQESYENDGILITTPESIFPPDTFYAPVPVVLDTAGRYTTFAFLLLDEELIELVEIEIGELLEDWSPWEEYYFLTSSH